MQGAVAGYNRGKLWLIFEVVDVQSFTREKHSSQGKGIKTNDRYGVRLTKVFLHKQQQQREENIITITVLTEQL